MGSYGIGVTRLMGTVVEVLSDDKGIIWPEAIAPFKVHLLSLGDTVEQAQMVYDQLLAKNIEVLFDDRMGVSAGEKFADSDLLGMPHRVVVSERSLAQGGFEYKKRDSSESTILSAEALIGLLTA
jgi:prolyl-tRNA synthetase